MSEVNYTLWNSLNEAHTADNFYEVTLESLSQIISLTKYFDISIKEKAEDSSKYIELASKISNLKNLSITITNTLNTSGLVSGVSVKFNNTDSGSTVSNFTVSISDAFVMKIFELSDGIIVRSQNSTIKQSFDFMLLNGSLSDGSDILSFWYGNTNNSYFSYTTSLNKVDLNSTSSLTSSTDISGNITLVPFYPIYSIYSGMYYTVKRFFVSYGQTSIPQRFIVKGKTFMALTGTQYAINID